MKTEALSKRVLASLLTMSCAYMGGDLLFSTVEAATNDSSNSVCQIITTGGSLTAGDIFNFNSTGSDNDTAIRFHGDNLNIPMTGEGVYTINGTGDNKSITGIDFSNTEKVDIGFLTDSFIEAKGTINGSFKLKLDATNGTATGVIISGGDKYTGTNSVEVASNIILNGKLNIDITGSGICGVDIKNGGQAVFKDDLTINGTNNGSNQMYGVKLAGNGPATFEKGLYIDLQNNNNGNSYGGVGVSIKPGWGKTNHLKVDGATTIKMNSENSNSIGLEFEGTGKNAMAKGTFGDIDISLQGNAVQKAINASYGQLDFNGDVKVQLGAYAPGVGSTSARVLYATNSSKINMNQSKNKTVQLQGYIVAASGSSVYVALTNEDSFWEGDAQIDGNKPDTAINVEVSNGAVWKPGGGWERYNEGMKLNLHDNGIVDMSKTSQTYESIKIGEVNGTGGLFKLETDIVNMKSDKLNILASTNAGTHSIDIMDVNEVTMDQIANNAGEGLLLATAPDGIKFTANDREQSLFYIRYNLKDESIGSGKTEWKLDSFEIVKEPTTSVSTVLSTNALNYHTWRSENDKLLQRMGELRQNGADAQGAWFRVRGSKVDRTGKFVFENKYMAYELGYDKVIKQTGEVTRYQGAAFSYTNGNSSYTRGSGDNNSKSVSLYNTEIGRKGHYLDMVFKISDMDNDFKIFDTNSNKINGNFNNIGVALSAEYGRKNALKNGWYIEPQAQFTLGYLGGDSYTTSNSINVDQSGIKSAVGRIGFNIGKEVGNKGIIYAKANLLHEFGGGYEVTMADDTGRVKVSDSFDDTWFEYGVGAALTTGSNSHIYFDMERSAGSDFTKNWQVNAGIRFEF